MIDADPVPAVELRGVGKSFGDNEALADIDIQVMPGETVCIVGPSGSGKSTLLRCINWLLPPDRGQVFLHGKRFGFKSGTNGDVAMTEAELAMMRTRIGMVFQHFNLWPHMTALGNIIESPVHVLGRRREEAIAEAEELLEKVGLTDKRDVYPGFLSGGQMQRVAIARALAMRPEVLLFDEATSALDPELVDEVLAVMQGLARDGLTMIVVTHEMHFARDAASHIVFLDKGRVGEVATAKDFFENPATDRARQFLERFNR